MNIEQLITKVKEINPAIYAEASGGYKIEGCHRGKKSERFQFDAKTGEFDYNTCGPAVATAFKVALETN